MDAGAESTASSQDTAIEGIPIAVHVAYFPDPAKVGAEPDYPPPAVRRVLSAYPDISLTSITVTELLAGCLVKAALFDHRLEFPS